MYTAVEMSHMSVSDRERTAVSCHRLDNLDNEDHVMECEFISCDIEFNTLFYAIQ